MNSRNRIRLVLLQSPIFIVLSCCSSYRVIMTQEEIKQDSGVIMYAKMAWNRTLSFIFLENDCYYTQSYYIHTSKEYPEIVHVRKDSVRCRASSEQLSDFCYSAKELKKYSVNDIHFQKTMTMIDSMFFDMSNVEKMKALDRWISSQGQ